MRRALGVAIVTLLVLGLGGAALPGVRNSREDLAALLQDADRQLASIRLQVEQVEQVIGLLRSQLSRTDEGLAMQRELLTLARATPVEVREMDRKTPDRRPG